MPRAAGVSIYGILKAPPCERGRVASEEIGGWAGSLAYGYVGAELFGGIGLAIGGPIGGGVGAIIGGVAGGIYGYNQGSAAGAAYYRAFTGRRRCACP